jgi:hypothetical protein
MEVMLGVVVVVVVVVEPYQAQDPPVKTRLDQG